MYARFTRSPSAISIQSARMQAKSTVSSLYGATPVASKVGLLQASGWELGVDQFQARRDTVNTGHCHGPDRDELLLPLISTRAGSLMMSRKRNENWHRETNMTTKLVLLCSLGVALSSSFAQNVLPKPEQAFTDAPVAQFWSFTVYDNESRCLIDTGSYPDRSSRDDSRTRTKDEDKEE